MKQNLLKIAAFAGICGLLGQSAFGQAPVIRGGAEVNAQVAVTPPPPPLPAAAVEVVKLSRAQVNEDVILTYVQNSRATCSLKSDEIVRMRNEGVSDRVINAMLEQNRKAVEVAQATPAPTPVYTDDANNPSQQQAPVVEAPLAPTAPASSVYVIPYAPTYYRPYYYGYPYYGYPYSYGYYGYPSFSFRFGFGGIHSHGGYRWGGGHWGGHGGGNWHGGGSWRGGGHGGHHR